MIGAGEATGLLQQALLEIDYQPEVTLLETNFYDPVYLEAAGAAGEGTYIRMVFTPFEEAADNPATARYLDLVEAVDGKVALLGAQSMSAWLLFATAAKAVRRRRRPLPLLHPRHGRRGRGVGRRRPPRGRGPVDEHTRRPA